MTNERQYALSIVRHIYDDISTLNNTIYPNGKKAEEFAFMCDFTKPEDGHLRNYLIFANQHHYIALYSYPHFTFANYLYKFLMKCHTLKILSGELYFYKQDDIESEIRDFKLPSHQLLEEPGTELDLYLIANYYNSNITSTNGTDCLLINKKHKWVFLSDHDYNIYLFFNKSKYSIEKLRQQFNFGINLELNEDITTGGQFLCHHNNKYSLDDMEDSHEIESFQ